MVTFPLLIPYSTNILRISVNIKVEVRQIEKALITDRLRVLKVP